MGKIVRIGIFYLKNNGIEETGKEIASFFVRRGVKVLYRDELSKIENAENTLIMSLGGDGTFLRAAHIGIKLNIPIIGVNLGNLGFLTDVEARDIFDAAEEVLKGKYYIEKRATLKMIYSNDKTEEKEFKAVNDFVLQRQITGKILSTEIFVNNMSAGNFRSDGMVVATPTGSTAYSLSLGGPIVSPLSNVFSLTFIAPHKLTARPVIFSDSDKLSVRILSSDNVFLLRDGEKIAMLNKFDRLVFQKNEAYLSIIHLKNKNFFDVLNKKFGWGM